MTWKLVLGPLRRRPARIVWAVAALSVGGAAAAAATSLWILSSDRILSELSAYGANLVVAPRRADRPLDVAGLPRLGLGFWRNNLQAACPVVEGAWESGGRTYRVVGTRFAGSIARADAPSGAVIPVSFSRLHPWLDVRGRFPSDAPVGRSPDRFEVAVFDPSGALRAGGALEAGSAARGAVRLLVVGELAGDPRAGSSATARDVAMPILLTTLAAAGRLLSREREIDYVLLRALTTPEYGLLEKFHRDPRSLPPEAYERWSCTSYPSTVAASIERAWPEASVRVERPVTEAEGGFLDRARLFLGLLAAFGFAGAALAVAGAVSHVLRDERGVVALLRTLGATRAELAAVYLGQSSVVGAAGAAGALAMAFAQSPLLPAGAAPGPAAAAVACTLCLAVTWLGAVVPVASALRAEPAPILHEQGTA